MYKIREEGLSVHPKLLFRLGSKMLHTAVSKKMTVIRLTPERWQHISQNHPELGGYLFDILDCVQNPDEIRNGSSGELLAVKRLEIDRVLVVAYREGGGSDGFVITAFITKRLQWLEKRIKIWP